MTTRSDSKPPRYHGIQVFSATRARERDLLDLRINEWIRVNPTRTVVACKVLQSSDQKYHCLSAVLFWAEPDAPAR
ncbi:MAG: hypothetical protein SF187_02065 [Deltaproteobacteria bacterium]|nr:hypothetical protein [Deltaproteobacteria bacterium]